MKINKAIFGVDESYFLEFWPIQARICKELLEIEPVLFLIGDEDSDFYNDGNGLVKKIKKVKNNQNGNLVHTGLLACIVRMYGTKYFPDEVCLTCDLDMLMINKDYFINQIKHYDDNSLVIYSSDAYDLNRPEAVELFNTEPFPFIQEMYNYPYNAAKGKIFNQILDTNCTFEEFVNRHANYKHGYNFMWMIDEFYFADCVNNKNHGVEVHKLKRGYTSPWIADRRIDRGNFPVQLEWEGEIEFQKKYGIYDEQKLRDGYYIDVNCCRPYSKYKDEIDKIVNIVLDDGIIEVVEIDETTELCEIMERHGSDKSCKPTWVDYEGHNYTRFYYKLFNKIKNKNINFFELGLGTNNVDIPCNMGKLGTPGASLRGWKEYFPNANIYGADIDKNILFNEDRIKTFYCDQTNSTEIEELWKNINKNFDIIIDDGLHEFNANLNFLKNSLNRLNDNGYYIIEDVVNGELNFWKEEIKKLRKEFTTFEFKIVKLKWTHDDNNLIVIQRKTTKNMKKIALISTFCDTDEKIYILIENLKKLKELGVDTLVISPIKLPSRIVELSDFVFFTKENPIFNWPERGFTFWQSLHTLEGWVTMHRNVGDYGWAGLYQVKKMSQIALSYDYDIFYHLIYDLEIDDYVANSIKNNDINLIHPRINPNKNDEIWDATLHYMIFDRENMMRVVDAINLKTYLETDGVAETQAHNWSKMFPINLAKTPVKDKIYYWGDRGFFDYSNNPKYKLFFSKNDNNTEIWVDSDNGKIPRHITSNLCLFLYDFIETQNLKIQINDIVTDITLNENKMIEFPIDVYKVKTLKIKDNEGEFDYFEILNEVNRNIIYFEK